MKTFKFIYPDIPYVSERALYDYLFNMDRLVREQGEAINVLVGVINGILNTK